MSITDTFKSKKINTFKSKKINTRKSWESINCNSIFCRYRFNDNLGWVDVTVQHEVTNFIMNLLNKYESLYVTYTEDVAVT